MSDRRAQPPGLRGAPTPTCESTTHAETRPMTAKHTTAARPRYALKASAVFAASLAAACAHGLPHPAEDTRMNAQPDTTTATADTRLRVQDGQEVSLHTEFHYSTDANTLLVRYRLRNGSADRALAVFDRGVYGDRAGATFNPGPVGAPRVEQQDGGTVLLHAPGPAPATAAMDPLGAAPLAVELEPGGELADQFVHRFTGTGAPKRVRWCVAVAPFDEKQFRNPVKTNHGPIWTATGDTSTGRQLLCTPWYDVGTARFVE